MLCEKSLNMYVVSIKFIDDPVYCSNYFMGSWLVNQNPAKEIYRLHNEKCHIAYIKK